MPLIPTALPGAATTTPEVRHRWSRVRRRLSLAILWLPAAHAATCLALLGIAMTTMNPAAWWILPLLGALLPFGAALIWFARTGVTDPPSWVKATLFTGAGQIFLGLIPAMAAAATGPATAVFLLGWVFFLASCVLAGSACRTLYAASTPELGGTPFRIKLGARYAMTNRDTVLCAILIDRDRITWSARRMPKRRESPDVESSAKFAELHEVNAITLPPGPPRQWFALYDGTPLYAEQGPAVVLRTTSGECLLPVHDAESVAELLHRRITYWRAGGNS